MVIEMIDTDRMSEVCNCDVAEYEHEHCKACEVVLHWHHDNGEDYCCFCVERMKKEGTWKEASE